MTEGTKITDKFEKIKEELATENDLSNQCSDVATACKIGFRKLRLAKEFSQIDEKLINLSNSDKGSMDFFSGILSLEAKRLAFKEEALKCQTNKIQINS